VTFVPDIVDLIMADHARIRELLGELSDAAVSASEADAGRPAMTWAVLDALLSAHLDAAEEIAYPALTDNAICEPGRAAELVADHGDIREALGEARIRPAGSAVWWLAVRAAVATAISHIDAIESGPLAVFRWEASPQIRETLGAQWVAFVTARACDADAFPEAGEPASRPASDSGQAMPSVPGANRARPAARAAAGPTRATSSTVPAGAGRRSRTSLARLRNNGVVPGHEFVKDGGEFVQAIKVGPGQLLNNAITGTGQADTDDTAVDLVRYPLGKAGRLGSVDQFHGTVRSQQKVVGDVADGGGHAWVVSLDGYQQLMLDMGQARVLGLILTPALETAQRDPEF
jgi:hypothetical protein